MENKSSENNIANFQISDIQILDDYEIVEPNDSRSDNIGNKNIPYLSSDIINMPTAPVLPNEFEDEKYSHLYKISYSEYGENGNYITLGYCALKNNAKEYIRRYAKEYVRLLDDAIDVRVVHKNTRIIIKYKVDWTYFYKSYETVFRYETDYNILLNKKINFDPLII